MKRVLKYIYLRFVVFCSLFLLFFFKSFLRDWKTFFLLFFILIVALAFPMPSLSIFLNILIRFVPVENSMFWFFICVTVRLSRLFNLKLFCFRFSMFPFLEAQFQPYTDLDLFILSIVGSYFIDSIELCIITLISELRLVTWNDS